MSGQSCKFTLFRYISHFVFIVLLIALFLFAIFAFFVFPAYLTLDVILFITKALLLLNASAFNCCLLFWWDVSIIVNYFSVDMMTFVGASALLTVLVFKCCGCSNQLLF